MSIFLSYGCIFCSVSAAAMKADSQDRNSSGATALVLAAQEQEEHYYSVALEIILVLLEAGANIHAADRDGLGLRGGG